MPRVGRSVCQKMRMREVMRQLGAQPWRRSPAGGAPDRRDPCPDADKRGGLEQMFDELVYPLCGASSRINGRLRRYPDRLAPVVRSRRRGCRGHQQGSARRPPRRRGSGAWLGFARTACTSSLNALSKSVSAAWGTLICCGAGNPGSLPRHSDQPGACSTPRPSCGRARRQSRRGRYRGVRRRPCR